MNIRNPSNPVFTPGNEVFCSVHISLSLNQPLSGASKVVNIWVLASFPPLSPFFKENLALAVSRGWCSVYFSIRTSFAVFFSLSHPLSLSSNVNSSHLDVCSLSLAVSLLSKSQAVSRRWCFVEAFSWSYKKNIWLPRLGN